MLRLLRANPAGLTGRAPRNAAEAGEWMARGHRVIGSPGYPLDEVWLRRIGELIYVRGGFDRAARARQGAAILQRGPATCTDHPSYLGPRPPRPGRSPHPTRGWASDGCRDTRRQVRSVSRHRPRPTKRIMAQHHRAHQSCHRPRASVGGLVSLLFENLPVGEQPASTISAYGLIAVLGRCGYCLRHTASTTAPR